MLDGVLSYQVYILNRVVVRYQIRVRVPEQVPGYGYNEMGMGMSTGTKPC